MVDGDGLVEKHARSVFRVAFSAQQRMPKKQPDGPLRQCSPETLSNRFRGLADGRGHCVAAGSALAGSLATVMPTQNGAVSPDIIERYSIASTSRSGCGLSHCRSVSLSRSNGTSTTRPSGFRSRA